MAGTGVHGVMVTHRMHPELSRVVERCAAGVELLYLVDNGNGALLLRELEARLPNVRLVEMGSNRGIATALNAGVTRALDAGAAWVLTMDHDTVLPEGGVRRMLAGLASCGGAGRVGIVAPRYVIRGKAGRQSQSPSGCRDLPMVMTSANLVSAVAFRSVGLFDEAYFIDYVDFEFCLRLRTAGFRIVEIGEVAVDHRLGEVRERSVLGVRVRHTHYDPARRYLKARNRILTYRRYFSRFPVWALRDVLEIPWELASAAVFEDRRAETLRAMLAGLGDGMLGRGGPPRFSWTPG